MSLSQIIHVYVLGVSFKKSYQSMEVLNQKYFIAIIIFGRYYQIINTVHKSVSNLFVPQLSSVQLLSCVQLFVTP